MSYTGVIISKEKYMHTPAQSSVSALQSGFISVAAIAAIVSLPVMVFAAQSLSYTFSEANGDYLYIDDVNQTSLDLSGNFTVEAWIKPVSIDANQPMDIVSKHSENDYGYAFGVNGIGGLAVMYRDDAGNISQFETIDPVMEAFEGQWVHVAVVVNQATPEATFYVNGIAVADTAIRAHATSIHNNAVQFRIGSRVTDSFYIDGKVDDVRVWNVTRTPNQIVNGMNGVNKDALGLVGYWKFNNATLRDATVNNNDLTASNSPYSADVPVF